MNRGMDMDPVQQPVAMVSPSEVELVVFSDDWGRHPSSSQHLARELLLRNRMCCHSGCSGCHTYKVFWVNTIGTRRPSLSLEDVSRGVGKLREWFMPGGKSRAHVGGVSVPGLGVCRELHVSDPGMWPGFRRPWQRHLNANLLNSHVHDVLGRRRDTKRVAMTTLPITADLVGRLDVDRWVYYCVDDFSTWPGLDKRVMQAMERKLVERVDEIIVVSRTLEQRIAELGRESTLLTHGIDARHWVTVNHPGTRPAELESTDGPVVLFWGLIDQRLDVSWCRALAEGLAGCDGVLVLAGPRQGADAVLDALPNTLLPGAVSYAELPRWARHADVLVMPYADLPVTRAMQPLKLKEYLATDRPVVLRDLPATQNWHDAADVVSDAGAFVDRVCERLDSGLPASQAHARQRLNEETWEKKALSFVPILVGEGQVSERQAA